MLLVRGPSIFNGYLNYSGPDPFTEVDGKRWYVTGDLVRLDEDGYIHFCGRLKRFLKIGGEMVSLPALEEPLSVRYPPTENGPQVAVEGVDAPSPLDRALYDARHFAQAGQRHPGRGRLARRDAAGCASSGSRRFPCSAREDGLQGFEEAGGGTSE